MPRPVRTLLVALATLAVCLVAWPAYAAAPLCDDRGASAFAAPPTLEPQNASVDVGMNPDPCADGVERDVSFHQGRAPDPLPNATISSALPAEVGVAVPPNGVASLVASFELDGLRLGVRNRLERPPRG